MVSYLQSFWTQHADTIFKCWFLLTQQTSLNGLTITADSVSTCEWFIVSVVFHFQSSLTVSTLRSWCLRCERGVVEKRG